MVELGLFNLHWPRCFGGRKGGISSIDEINNSGGEDFEEGVEGDHVLSERILGRNVG